MKRKRAWLSLGILVLAVTAASFAFSFFRTERETLPPDSKFEFQFGRGSGWHGLDLLRITSNGQAEYEFQTTAGEWRRKTFLVPEKQIVDLREAINDLGILDLRKSYHGDVADGTQWCLLIKEEGKARSFYFDNSFPAPIQKLADFVDRTILEPFADPIEGKLVPARHHREHEKEIWASVR